MVARYVLNTYTSERIYSREVIKGVKKENRGGEQWRMENKSLPQVF